MYSAGRATAATDRDSKAGDASMTVGDRSNLMLNFQRHSRYQPIERPPRSSITSSLAGAYGGPKELNIGSSALSSYRGTTTTPASTSERTTGGTSSIPTPSSTLSGYERITARRAAREAAALEAAAAAAAAGQPPNHVDIASIVGKPTRSASKEHRAGREGKSSASRSSSKDINGHVGAVRSSSKTGGGTSSRKHSIDRSNSIKSPSKEAREGVALQRFDIIRKLGSGTYGKVSLAMDHKHDTEVAVKIIKKSAIDNEQDLLRIKREIRIMSALSHPNIIEIKEVFENNEKIIIVMEYASGGELYDYVSTHGQLSEEDARRIFRQITSAVYFCHKHNVAHRDLKLENILLDVNMNAKIADFGLSNYFSDRGGLLKTFCGSPLYASPEIINGTPYRGPEVDCWSLGVLLYTLIYGSMPFDGRDFNRMIRQIKRGAYYEPDNPTGASMLIRTMLRVNPERRADIEDIASHWWLNLEENAKPIADLPENQIPVDITPLIERKETMVVQDLADEAEVFSEYNHMSALTRKKIEEFRRRRREAEKCIERYEINSTKITSVEITRKLSTDAGDQAPLTSPPATTGATWTAGAPVVDDLDPLARLKALEARLHGHDVATSDAPQTVPVKAVETPATADAVGAAVKEEAAPVTQKPPSAAKPVVHPPLRELQIHVDATTTDEHMQDEPMVSATVRRTSLAKETQMPSPENQSGVSVQSNRSRHSRETTPTSPKATATARFRRSSKSNSRQSVATASQKSSGSLLSSAGSYQDQIPSPQAGPSRSELSQPAATAISATAAAAAAEPAGQRAGSAQTETANALINELLEEAAKGPVSAQLMDKIRNSPVFQTHQFVREVFQSIVELQVEPSKASEVSAPSSASAEEPQPMEISETHNGNELLSLSQIKPLLQLAISPGSPGSATEAAMEVDLDNTDQAARSATQFSSPTSADETSDTSVTMPTPRITRLLPDVVADKSVTSYNIKTSLHKPARPSETEEEEDEESSGTRGIADVKPDLVVESSPSPQKEKPVAMVVRRQSTIEQKVEAPAVTVSIRAKPPPAKPESEEEEEEEEEEEDEEEDEDEPCSDEADAAAVTAKEEITILSISDFEDLDDELDDGSSGSSTPDDASFCSATSDQINLLAANSSRGDRDMTKEETEEFLRGLAKRQSRGKYERSKFLFARDISIEEPSPTDKKRVGGSQPQAEDAPILFSKAAEYILQYPDKLMPDTENELILPPRSRPVSPRPASPRPASPAAGTSGSRKMQWLKTTDPDMGSSHEADSPSPCPPTETELKTAHPSTLQLPEAQPETKISAAAEATQKPALLESELKKPLAKSEEIKLVPTSKDDLAAAVTPSKSPGQFYKVLWPPEPVSTEATSAPAPEAAPSRDATLAMPKAIPTAKETKSEAPATAAAKPAEKEEFHLMPAPASRKPVATTVTKQGAPPTIESFSSGTAKKPQDDVPEKAACVALPSPPFKAMDTTALKPASVVPIEQPADTSVVASATIELKKKNIAKQVSLDSPKSATVTSPLNGKPQESIDVKFRVSITPDRTLAIKPMTATAASSSSSALPVKAAEPTKVAASAVSKPANLVADAVPKPLSQQPPAKPQQTSEPPKFFTFTEIPDVDSVVKLPAPAPKDATASTDAVKQAASKDKEKDRTLSPETDEVVSPTTAAQYSPGTKRCLWKRRERARTTALLSIGQQVSDVGSEKATKPIDTVSTAMSKVETKPITSAPSESISTRSSLATHKDTLDVGWPRPSSSRPFSPVASAQDYRTRTAAYGLSPDDAYRSRSFRTAIESPLSPRGTGSSSATEPYHNVSFRPQAETKDYSSSISSRPRYTGAATESYKSYLSSFQHANADDRGPLSPGAVEPPPVPPRTYSGYKRYDRTSDYASPSFTGANARSKSSHELSPEHLHPPSSTLSAYLSPQSSFRSTREDKSPAPGAPRKQVKSVYEMIDDALLTGRQAAEREYEREQLRNTTGVGSVVNRRHTQAIFAPSSSIYSSERNASGTAANERRGDYSSTSSSSYRPGGTGTTSGSSGSSYTNRFQSVVSSTPAASSTTTTTGGYRSRYEDSAAAAHRKSFYDIEREEAAAAAITAAAERKRSLHNRGMDFLKNQRSKSMDRSVAHAVYNSSTTEPSDLSSRQRAQFSPQPSVERASVAAAVAAAAERRSIFAQASGGSNRSRENNGSQQESLFASPLRGILKKKPNGSASFDDDAAAPASSASRQQTLLANHSGSFSHDPDPTSGLSSAASNSNDSGLESTRSPARSYAGAKTTSYSAGNPISRFTEKIKRHLSTERMEEPTSVSPSTTRYSATQSPYTNATVTSASASAAKSSPPTGQNTAKESRIPTSHSNTSSSGYGSGNISNTDKDTSADSIVEKAALAGCTHSSTNSIASSTAEKPRKKKMLLRFTKRSSAGDSTAGSFDRSGSLHSPGNSLIGSPTAAGAAESDDQSRRRSLGPSSPFEKIKGFFKPKTGSSHNGVANGSREEHAGTNGFGSQTLGVHKSVSDYSPSAASTNSAASAASATSSNNNNSTTTTSNNNNNASNNNTSSSKDNYAIPSFRKAYNSSYRPHAYQPISKYRYEDSNMY